MVFMVSQEVFFSHEATVNCYSWFIPLPHLSPGMVIPPCVFRQGFVDKSCFTNHPLKSSIIQNLSRVFHAQAG